MIFLSIHARRYIASVADTTLNTNLTNSLCTYYTLDEYDAWFRLYGLHRAGRNEQGVNNLKWKIYVSIGFEPASVASFEC